MVRIITAFLLAAAVLCGTQQAPSPEELLERGRSLERAGKTAEAEQVYERAARAHPNVPAFQYKLGILAMQRGAWPKAIAAFETCLRVFPRQVDTILLLVEAYERNGDSQRALETTRRAAGVHPEHPGVCRAYGRHLCQSGKCDDALKWLLKARKVSPDLPGIDYDIGLTYLELNDWARAQSHLEAAAAREPDNPQIRFLLGEACRHTRDWEKALENYERAVAGGKRDARTYYGLGAALATLGRHQEAIPALEQAYRLDPSLPAELHFMLAKSLRAVGRNEEADREMALRLRLMEVKASGNRFTTAGDPAEEGLWKELSGLLAQGREADARALLKARVPESNVSYMLGAGYFVLGKIPEATRHVRAALAEQPNLPNARAYLGKLALAAGDLEGAEAEVQSELKRDPRNQLALATLGEIRFAQERWAEAAEAIEGSRTKNTGALLKLCEAYFRLGRKTDADVTVQLLRVLAGNGKELAAEIDRLTARWAGK